MFVYRGVDSDTPQRNFQAYLVTMSDYRLIEVQLVLLNVFFFFLPQGSLLGMKYNKLTQLKPQRPLCHFRIGLDYCQPINSAASLQTLSIPQPIYPGTANGEHFTEIPVSH